MHLFEDEEDDVGEEDDDEWYFCFICFVSFADTFLLQNNEFQWCEGHCFTQTHLSLNPSPSFPSWTLDDLVEMNEMGMGFVFWNPIWEEWMCWFHVHSIRVNGWMNEGVFDLCCCSVVGGLKRFLLFADWGILFHHSSSWFIPWTTTLVNHMHLSLSQPLTVISSLHHLNLWDCVDDMNMIVNYQSFHENLFWETGMNWFWWWCWIKHHNHSHPGWSSSYVWNQLKGQSRKTWMVWRFGPRCGRHENEDWFLFWWWYSLEFSSILILLKWLSIFCTSCIPILCLFDWIWKQETHNISVVLHSKQTLNWLYVFEKDRNRVWLIVGWLDGWLKVEMEWFVCVWCDVLKEQSCWMSSRHFIVDLKHCFILNSIKNNNSSTWKQPQTPQSFNSVWKNKQQQVCKRNRWWRRFHSQKRVRKDKNQINGIPSQSVFIPVSSFLIITCERHLMNWRINHTLENWLTNDTIWFNHHPIDIPW